MPTEIVLSFTGEVLQVPLRLNLYLGGAPASLQLTTQSPLSINGIWQTISDALYEVSGLSLPDLTGGPWGAFLTGLQDNTVAPSLWITPSNADGNFSAYLELAFSNAIHIGGTKTYGPVEITLAPDISILALYISYDKGQGGFDFKAKISQPTQPSQKALTAGASAGATEKIVTYPFPLPSQGSVPVFKLNYLGLGQRVGPTTVVTANDPLAAIFEQLETQLTGNDPVEVLTELAKNFYQPDRGWFIAADISFRGFQLRVIFNDPTIYGLELTAGPGTPLAGLLFEILYQKLGPNLGVYYGALTLPDFLRRIVINGVILILPGFQIWVYTNGDFRVNVGWPLGPNSIGIQVGILVGAAGFYFAKLRSADNPGAQSNVNYNPILAFGIGISVYVQESFSASIFSASLSVTLTATFQGLLAWYAGSSPNASASLAKPPDHYWFAGTASLAVLIQGSVDFSILKASVTISFNASVGVAFETGYITLVAVSADVSVRVSVKVLFFTIHLSFSTSISHNFYIGSGSAVASINGPLAPGLAIVGGTSLKAAAVRDVRERALTAVSSLIASTAGTRLAVPLMTPRMAAGSPAVTVDVHFVLQPTAVYTGATPTVDLIASLLVDAPAPGSPQGQTSFEQLIRVMVDWLLTYSTQSDALSKRFQEVVDQLGDGSRFGPDFGSWEGFALACRTFLESSVVFRIHGVDAASPGDETSAAILPMIDALTLSYTGAGGAQTIPFDSFNPTPPDYPQAINFYYDALSWSGPAGPANAPSGLWQASGSPLATPSMAAYLFYDYFLMQCRNVAKQLLSAAQAYEEGPTQAFLSQVERAHERGETDPWHFLTLATSYRAQVVAGNELNDLLAAFDYASVAGLGSRYLVHGLQLPDPSKVPSPPTPGNMSSVPTDGLYVLTGQQFAVAAGTTLGSATLSMGVDAPVSWIAFDSAAGSTSTIPLPGAAPPAPAPQWHGTSLLATGSANGEIDLNVLPPLTAQPLSYAIKNQLAWTAPGGTHTILPLPSQLQTLAAGGGLQAAVSTQPPGTAAASPSASVHAAGGLLISLSISPVPSNSASNVGSAGSPAGAAGSPGASGSVKYLPNVYQVNPTDEATRDLLQQALEGDLTGATLTLLYTENGALVSETLGASVLLAKTNLSTLNQAPQVALLFAAKMAAFQQAFQNVMSAPATNVGAFLSLIWEESVVNAPGFFLYYITADGQDLPASLFSDAGVGGGQTAQFDILLTAGAPAATVALQPWQNCLWIPEPAGPDSLYAAITTAAGAPVLQYSPTYPPGNVGFEILWRQVPQSPEPPVPVDLLYQLIQFQVQPQEPYRQSVWSLPNGPTEATPGDASPNAPWHYQQSVPVYRFAGPASPATETPYMSIGEPASLGFRLIDIYGNPMPDIHTSPFTPLYNDPLLTLGQWPGVSASFYVNPAAASSASLVIAAVFDPKTLVVEGPSSPPLGPNQPDARRQWQAIQASYFAILAQLVDPNLKVSVSTSLTGGAVGDGAAVHAQLAGFAQAILEQIQHAIDSSSSPDYWSADSVSTSIVLPVPFGSVAALPANIFPITVSIDLSRPPTLVYPPALQELPSVASVSGSIPADLNLTSATSPPVPSSPPPTGVQAFAARFEAAFTGFDGGQGVLKLAQRADLASGAGAGQVPTFWAVRWSGSAGIEIAFPDATAASPDAQIVYLAMRPLSNALLGGTVNGQTFSGIDLDAWAEEFLLAFDAFLSPAMAVAIAILDNANGTHHYRDLLQCKQALAGVIPKGLQPVFSSQAGMGDIAAAQARFEQAILTALGNAFSVSTILQTPAAVTMTGASEAGSPFSAPPRLYGSVGPASSSPSSSSHQYTISAGELDLVRGQQWLTSLVSVAQPTEQSMIEVPLDYQVGYLQHEFGTEEMGYTPSAWLKFALPAGAPLSLSITGGRAAQIPIPLIFYPDPPVLVAQSANGTPLTSPPPSPQTIASEIAATLEWDYRVQLSHRWAEQDEVYFDVVFNQPQASSGPEVRGASVDQLFAALGTFQQVYPTLAPHLGSIPAEAFSGSTGSPGAAAAVIEQFVSLAQAVASAWPDYAPVARRPLLKMSVAPPTRDYFFVQLDSLSPGTLHLYGHAETGGPPGHWPAVTAGGQYWQPVPASPADPVVIGSPPQDWYEASHTFTVPKGEDPLLFFQALTLTWATLDVRQEQMANMSAFVVRNASLTNVDRAVNPLFVYTTETVRFANPVIPLIHRASLPPLPPDTTLAATIDDVLSPIASAGAGLGAVLRLSVSYSYQLLSGPGGAALSSSMPILLADGISMDAGSPGPVANDIAREVGNWYRALAPSTAGGQLLLALTLFGMVQGQQLPLVEIDVIPINVGNQPPGWWNANS